MRPYIFSIVAVTALAWGLSAAVVPASAQGAVATAQSSVRGVTVKVTPREVGEAADTWILAVVLDTHSQELADDLLQSTVLVTDDGRDLKPSAWKGAAAGGHHREGTLEFPAPKPAPRTFELRMQRPGEAEPRIFRFGS